MEYEKRENMAGFLKKKKGSGFYRIFGNTNLRWFEVDYKSKIFGYKVAKSSNKFKKSIPFDDLTSFIDQLDKDDKNSCDWRYGFQVLTKKKKLILYTQTETEYNNWIYAFKIVFKKIPEAFPRIKESVFIKAIQIFETPYLEAVKKKKMHEEQERRKKEQARLIKQKLEEEERIRKIMEEDERLRRKEEEDLKLKREEEEKLRIIMEEENLRKLKEEKEKDKKRLYDIQHESIISELDENILTYENKRENELNNSFNLNKSMNRSFASINYKDDIDDWNFYDENNEKIGENELENFNPLPELKEITQEKKEKENDIKSFLKNSLHLDSPFIINIESTATNKISDIKNCPKPDIASFKETNSASTKSKMETHESKYSSTQQAAVNHIPIIYSVSEAVNNQSNDGNPINTNQNVIQSIQNEEKIHLIPSTEKTKEFSKKPKFFKRKSEVDSISDSQNTQNSSLINKEKNNSKLHIDRDLGKSLIKNLELNSQNKHNSKVNIIEQETSLKLVFNKNEKLGNNYTTNIATGKDHVLSLEDDENWFEKPNIKRNNSTNNLPVIEGIDKKYQFEFDKLDDSINEKIDKKNYSFNYNDASENDLSFSGVSNSNNSFNNTNTNIPPGILESEISFDKGDCKNFAIQEAKIKEIFTRKDDDDNYNNHNNHNNHNNTNNTNYNYESDLDQVSHSVSIKNQDSCFQNNDKHKEEVDLVKDNISSRFQSDTKSGYNNNNNNINNNNINNNHFNKIYSIPARQKRMSNEFDIFKNLDKDDEFDQVLKKETITPSKNINQNKIKMNPEIEKVSISNSSLPNRDLVINPNTEASLKNKNLISFSKNNQPFDEPYAHNAKKPEPIDSPYEIPENSHEFSFDLKQKPKKVDAKLPKTSINSNINLFDQDFENW